MAATRHALLGERESGWVKVLRVAGLTLLAVTLFVLGLAVVVVAVTD